ncbi:type II secretion system protein GspD [bacterium]|nr:MAG: type II secretion system protein GspD [bacterium]
MIYRRILLPTLCLLSVATLPLQVAAQTLPSEPTAPAMDAPMRVATPQTAEKLYSFKFEGADLDTVMETYCEWTGQIYLKNDAVKATITLKASGLTKKECIQVVEAILGMNNIALVPMDEKFLKVVQSTAPDLGGQGLRINMDPGKQYGQTDKLVTQIIQLQHVQIPEVQTAVQHLMHAYGKIQTLERSNSLMITDTESNIIRIRELIEFIDQASAGIEPRIYKIEHADASEIAAKLSEIITMAQEDQTPGSSPSARTPPGVIRARSTRGTPTKPAAPTQATISKTQSSADLIIRGKVKVLADERTNIIIIFSQEDNFEFFDKIIKVLDVEIDPAITFEVINLEYADAEDLAGTLNELVGAATGSRSGSSSSSSRSSSSRSRTSGIQRASGRSSSSSSSRSSRITPNASSSGASIQNLSRLSEETRILSDERSNSVLLMGEKSDIAALKEVIKSLDIMLEQVVIEAAIFEIGLGNELRHGIDWLYKSLDANGQTQKLGAWDGSSLVTNTVNSLVSGAFNYYQNLSGLDSQILINLSLTDQDARLISTPIIMTTDNTEATLTIGEQRPVVTTTDSFSNTGGSLRSNYEYKDIGIQLTVTPRINPQRFVIMEIIQKADQIGTLVEIDGNEVPTILNREFEATVAVPDGGTVVLGGLMSSEMKDSITKIPILGDIPLIGRYLFSSVTKVEDQRELIVLMTPYVMSNLEEMQGQTERLYRGTSLKQEDWGQENWSESKLRQIPDPEEEPTAQNTTSSNLESQATATAEKDEMIDLLNSMDQ